MNSPEPTLKPIPRPHRSSAPLVTLVIYLLLLIVPPALKLAGPLAAWSWWWVASPFWVVYGVIGLVGFVAVLVHWSERAFDL